jgi:uncharacterized protein YndB with AHSA1/START domain
MTNMAPATHGSFTIERAFNAKPERVFAAFSSFEARSRWFSGPPGWVPKERSLDFRVGGTEIANGQWPDGKITKFNARFEEIQPDRRIVYTYHMHIDDWHISVSLATVEILPQGDGTKLIFTEHATFLNGYDDPGAAGREEGSIGLLDRLEAFLRC